MNDPLLSTEDVALHAARFDEVARGMTQFVFPQKAQMPNGLLESSGLSKRELFAAMAMQGILSCTSPPTGCHGYNDVARFAVRAADELLTALDKTP